MSVHPNVAAAHRIFDAFGGGDPRALFELLDESIVWRVSGPPSVASEYVGREEVFGLFRKTRRLTNGTYFSTLRWALADDEHATVLYRATGEREGRALDIDQVLLCEVRDGRWVDVTALPVDRAAFDAFWA